MSLVIIRTAFTVKPTKYDQMYELFCKQKEHGVILLPPGFEAIYVSDDVEIKRDDDLMFNRCPEEETND